MLARLVLLSLLLGVPRWGRAQECPEPPLRGPQLVAPLSNANAVTLDAPVILTYSEGYFGPGGPGGDISRLVTLEECGDCSAPCTLGSGLPVAGRAEVFGDRLYFVPDAPYADRTAYVGIARGAEVDLRFSFCTGRNLDAAAPVLEGFSRPSSTRVDAQCGLPDGGYRLAVTFPPATDDGPPGSIEYLLYLSRGEGLDAPRVVARAYNYPAASITLGVLLTPEEVSVPICLSLAAADGVGNVTVDPTPQCFDAITRTTFAGEACAASPARRASALSVGLALALAFVVLRRAR